VSLSVAKVWIKVIDDLNRLVTPHFKLGELVCPCCGELIEDDLFTRHMAKLEETRILAAFPIVVNSGHRCEKHNAEVNGAPESMHLRFATDVRPASGDVHELKVMYRIALTQNWGGIGVYYGRIHLDCRDQLARWNYATDRWWV
jgi:hypothetical protein